MKQKKGNVLLWTSLLMIAFAAIVLASNITNTTEPANENITQPLDILNGSNTTQFNVSDTPVVETQTFEDQTAQIEAPKEKEKTNKEPKKPETVSVIVMLKDTPSVKDEQEVFLSTNSKKTKDKAIKALKEEVFDSQKAVINDITDLGGKVKEKYFLSSGMSVEIPKDKLDELENNAFVESVSPDLKVYALENDFITEGADFDADLATSFPLIHAITFHDLGYNGSGTTVAVLDSGSYNTSTIVNKIVQTKDFTNWDTNFSALIDTNGIWNRTLMVPPAANELNFTVRDKSGGVINKLEIKIFNPAGAVVRAVNVTSFPRKFYNVSSPAAGNWKVQIFGEDVGSNVGYLLMSTACGASSCIFNTSADDSGHGTHVASTVAGDYIDIGGNTGSGVANGTQLLIGKVLTDTTGNSVSSGSLSNIMAGIDWAVANGADIISMSLGASGAGSCTDSLSEYINNITQEYNVLFVISAGNSGPSSGSIGFPGCAESALTVGATDDSDVIASFSSRGPTGDSRIKPDVTAPGVGIYATTYQGNDGQNWAVSKQGTSMAAPHVSGMAALLLSYDPSLSPSEMKALLMVSAKELGSAGRDNNYGSGRIDGLTLYGNSSNFNSSNITNGAVQCYNVSVNSTMDLRAVLYWPETFSMNDKLNLNIYNPGGSLNSSATSITDNVKDLRVSSAGSGIWSICVIGASVSGSQEYTVAYNAPFYSLPADETAPVVEWDWAQINSTILVNSSVICVNASELVNCTLQINGTKYANSTTATTVCWDPEFVDGNFTINATCDDPAANNANTTTAWLLVDAATPILSWNWADINSSIPINSTLICVDSDQPVNCTLDVNGTEYVNSTVGTTLCWDQEYGEGNYTFQATCDDVVGNNANTSSSWLDIDTIYPRIDWDWTDINSSITVNNSLVCINASESVNCTLDVDGTIYQNTTLSTSVCWNQEFNDGNHTLNATCEDPVGNVNKTSNSWLYVDAIAPTLSWNWTDINSSITVNSTLVCVDSTEPVNCTLQINGTKYANSTVNTTLCWNSEFAEGNYTINASCDDPTGNNANTTAAWLNIDTVPPTITWTWSPRNVSTNQSSHNITISSSESLNSCTLNLTNSSTHNIPMSSDTSMTYYYEWNGSTDYNHTLIVECNDSTGNNASTTEAWLNVDTQLLAFSWNWADANTSIKVNNTSICVTAAEKVNCTLHLDANTYPNSTRTTDPCWYNDSLAETNYTTIYVTCEDIAENEGNTTVSWLNVDFTAPTLSWTWADINSSTNYKTSNVTISSDERLTECNLTVNGTIYAVSGSGTSWWTELSGLPDGNYTLWANCSDVANHIGNTTTAWWYFDTHAPQVSWTWDDINTSITINSTNITALTNETVVACNLQIGGINYTMFQNSSTTYYYESNDTLDGNHTYRVYCNDTVNNVGVSTIAWLNVDTTNPRIGWDWEDINRTTSYNSTTIGVNASEPVNCTVRFDGTPYLNSTRLFSPVWYMQNQTGGNHTVNVTCEDVVGRKTNTTTAWWYVNRSAIDLNVSSANITLSSSNPRVGNTITITADIFNFGTTNASNVTIAFLLDGLFQSNNSLNISGDSYNTTTFSWKAAGVGYHNITIVADYGNNISESLEDNNNASKEIRVRTKDTSTGGGSSGGGGSGGAMITGGLIISGAEGLPDLDGTEEPADDGPSGDEPTEGDFEIKILGELVDGEEFTVVIVDESGNPVVGALVKYGNQKAITGTDGKVTFIAEEGVTEINVSKDGFEDLNKPVDVEPAKIKEITEQEQKPTIVVKNEGMDMLLVVLIIIVIIVSALAVYYVKFKRNSPKEPKPSLDLPAESS